MRRSAAALALLCAAAPAFGQPAAPAAVAPGHATYPFPPNVVLHNDSLNAALDGKAGAIGGTLTNPILAGAVASTAGVRVSLGDPTHADWDRFGPGTNVGLRVAVRGGNNGIVGMVDNNLPPLSVTYPTGVTGAGRISAGSRGAVSFGVYGECQQFDSGTCTNEFDAFNYAGTADPYLPPQIALGTTRVLPVSMTVGAGGTGQVALAIRITPEGSHPSSFVNGIYFEPTAVTSTAIIVDSSSTRGAATAADLRNIGTAPVLKMVTVGPSAPGNPVWQSTRLDNGLTYAAVTQDGTILSGPGAAGFGAGPASCVSGGQVAVPGDAQSCRRTLRTTTTSVQPTPMTVAALPLAAGVVPPVQPNGTLQAAVLVTARNPATGASAGWRCDGLLRRAGAGAGSTVAVGTPACTSIGADGAMAGTTAALGAEPTTGALAVTVGGLAATTLRWTALVDTVDVQ